ncbi:hypothetical protein PARMER_00979 [Parabacteroides merdae ATCC 43184]|nr:hypothetical protein PARMER_00979 [Parabacteroides merdae ATCC 43184]
MIVFCVLYSSLNGNLLKIKRTFTFNRSEHSFLILIVPLSPYTRR